MVKLTSPYNFVPLNKCVYIPDWAEKVSQDIPFEDGEDGWIEVTWKNVSPLIVRNASTKEDPYPVHFTEADGKKLYFIPGTSMKGMLRSTLEILSFGKMEQYRREIEKKKKKYNVQSLVEKEQKPVEGKDLCETIFGYTNGDDGLRGRVQVGHAFCTDKTDGRELLDEVSGVLGEPKPSFYPLYLKQTTPPYKTYNNAEGIAGRKLYRVHQKGSVSTLPKGSKKTESSFQPLRCGLSFVMRINLHNMRPVEIGAILSALTLHNTEGVWHNLGGAKSFGYGKMECVKVEIKGLKHQEKEEYMRAFEEEMENFTKKWSETEQVKALVGILSEHSDEEVRMMTLNEYKEASKPPFQKLNEGNRGLTSLLSQDFDKKYKKKKFVDEHKDKYEEAERLKQEGKLSKAINVYNELIRQLGIESLSIDEERKIIEEINAAIEKKKKEKEDEEEVARNARRAQGLAAQLEEKYGDGRYKRDTVKKALDVAATWLKQSKQTELTDDEKKDLYSTLKRLKGTQHKDDRNLWNGRDKKGWERIKKLIGEDLTEMLKTGETAS